MALGKFFSVQIGISFSVRGEGGDGWMEAVGKQGRERVGVMIMALIETETIFR